MRLFTLPKSQSGGCGRLPQSRKQWKYVRYLWAIKTDNNHHMQGHIGSGQDIQKNIHVYAKLDDVGSKDDILRVPTH